MSLYSVNRHKLTIPNAKFVCQTFLQPEKHPDWCTSKVQVQHRAAGSQVQVQHLLLTTDTSSAAQTAVNRNVQVQHSC